MTGIFIGKSSQGFENGKEYSIYSEIRLIRKHGEEMLCVCIFDNDSPAWCPYSSLEAVLRNWKFV